MKEHTGRLLEIARENIRAACLLQRQSYLRIAAARAYYAMFYVAEALLFEEGLQFSKHGGVHAAFGERFAKTGRMDTKFHRYLLDAFEERQLSDYEPAEEVSDNAVSQLIKRAEEFVEAGERFLREASG